ncbi:MAG: hypothetical protein K2Y01_00100 [Rhabdochlamydiaceae bacterium]|nr:hypothetical protein [Rhabdochlamydiaceae bacterium]
MEAKKASLAELTDYEKLIDSLGREIAVLYEICGGLRELVDQTKSYPEQYEKFKTFFYITYRSWYHEVYHGVSRLIDTSKGAVSLIKLLKTEEKDKPTGRRELQKIEKELSKRIEENEIAKKMKNFRDKKLGHKNKQLVLNAVLANQFFEENQLNLDDVEALLHVLGDALKKASERSSFRILTLPVTPIRAEIRNLFEHLSVK